MKFAATPAQQKLFSAMPAPMLAAFGSLDPDTQEQAAQAMEEAASKYDDLGVALKAGLAASLPFMMAGGWVLEGADAATMGPMGAAAAVAALPPLMLEKTTQDDIESNLFEWAMMKGAEPLNVADLKGTKYWPELVGDTRSRGVGDDGVLQKMHDAGVIDDDLFVAIKAEAGGLGTLKTREKEQRQQVSQQVAADNRAQYSGGGKAVKTEGFKGYGGYSYEILADGSVRISDAPPGFERVIDRVYKPGTGPHTAIMNEYEDRFFSAKKPAAKPAVS